MSVAIDVSEAVRDFLLAHRPAEWDPELPIRALSDETPVEYPYLVVLAEESDAGHPLLRVVEVTLELRLRLVVDEPRPAAGPFLEAGAPIWAGLPLAAQLAELGYQVLKVARRAGGWEIERGARVATYSAGARLWLRADVAALPQ